jgi:mercuric ion binding protein
MTEASLKTLINDAGFTLRQFQVQPVKPKNE